MKLYLKVIDGSRYTCLPQSVPAAQTAQRKVAAPGAGAAPKDQRLLMIATPKQVQHIHIHASNNQKLRNSTTIHENSKQNYARTILCITTIAWT